MTYPFDLIYKQSLILFIVITTSLLLVIHSFVFIRITTY